jgi:predicted peroxiredoxin
VRKGATEHARLNPLDPTIKDMIDTVVDSGGKILVCPPCAGVRGYTQEDLMDGVTLAGSVAMLDVVQQGAEAITF